jgi:hypothetical protein
MDFGGVWVRWGVGWLKSTRDGVSPTTHNVRLQSDIKLILSLSDSSMIDGICLHRVYMTKKEKRVFRHVPENPHGYLFYWWRIPDSNRGPADYDAQIALPAIYEVYRITLESHGYSCVIPYAVRWGMGVRQFALRHFCMKFCATLYST